MFYKTVILVQLDEYLNIYVCRYVNTKKVKEKKKTKKQDMILTTSIKNYNFFLL